MLDDVRLLPEVDRQLPYDRQGSAIWNGSTGGVDHIKNLAVRTPIAFGMVIVNC